MFTFLVRVVFVSISISVIISSVSIAYSTYCFVLEGQGTARIDILKQVSDANNLNRENMESIITLLSEELSPLMIEDDSGAIEEKVMEMQRSLDRFNLNYSIDVVLRDRRTFSGVAGSELRLKNLLNSYWYIKQLSGEKRINWNLSFLSPDDITSYALVCSQPVFDINGYVIGIIVLNSTQESLFQTYQEILEESGRVYILDENGIIVSHSNQTMIGQWLKSMSAFEKDPGYNSYVIKADGNRKYIMANYRDPVSGWTFVEERDITTIYNSVSQTLLINLSVVILGGVLACYLGYLYVRRVSGSLVNMTDEVSNLNPEDLQLIHIDHTYREIDILSSAFNHLIRRIQALIRDIQLREAEKRRTEYDFQQAQLSPHFLHNTLVAVKSLIYMEQYDSAYKMLEQFEELLHIPTSPDIQFVTIAEELHLIETYVSIMNCRTDKSVEFESSVPEPIQNIPIPRMLLQPIVGNSLFHGFAEKEVDCRITVNCSIEDGLLYIRLTDNGEGITPERLAELEKDDYLSKEHHHGIGIKNIRKRLNYIYGGRSAIIIESVPGEGTSVLLKIDKYDELPPTEETLRDQKLS